MQSGKDVDAMICQLMGSRGARQGGFSKWADSQSQWERTPKGYGGAWVTPSTVGKG